MTFFFACSVSCNATDKGKKAEGKKAPPTTTATSDRPVKEAIAHVPVGKFLAGSLPGEPGRDPSLEPTESTIELGPFRIDAYPFPGDPNQPPRLGVSATEAQALCASKGARLCTELEWERACRGPDSATYPTGASPCPRDDKTCLSGFDVAQMGTHPEWTASRFGKESDHAGKPVARGAPAGVTRAEARCARRAPMDKDESVGFRCCYGAPNAKTLGEPHLGEAFKEVEITKKDLAKLLETDERTKDLVTDLSLFQPETTRTVLARGAGDTKGFTLTSNAVLWQPDRGSTFLVASGRSGKKTSFVVAYFVAGEKRTLAGSFVMKNEPGPISLAYARSIRPRMHFSGCWGCPGETGKLLFRPPEELVLLQP